MTCRIKNPLKSLVQFDYGVLCLWTSIIECVGRKVGFVIGFTSKVCENPSSLLYRWISHRLRVRCSLVSFVSIKDNLFRVEVDCYAGKVEQEKCCSPTKLCMRKL